MKKHQLELQKGRAKNRLQDAAINRWLPCPDHRDKVSGGCYVCRNESLTAELQKLKAVLEKINEEARRGFDDLEFAEGIFPTMPPVNAKDIYKRNAERMKRIQSLTESNHE